MIYRNDTTTSMNEIKFFHDCKWIESCETTWKILNLFFDEIKSSMNRLQMHLKNVQCVLINFNDRTIKEKLKKNELFRQINWLNISKWMFWSKKRKKSINHFFTSTTTSIKILKIIWFILFDINSSKSETSKKKANASSACTSWIQNWRDILFAIVVH